MKTFAYWLPLTVLFLIGVSLNAQPGDVCSSAGTPSFGLGSCTPETYDMTGASISHSECPMESTWSDQWFIKTADAEEWNHTADHPGTDVFISVYDACNGNQIGDCLTNNGITNGLIQGNEYIIKLAFAPGASGNYTYCLWEPVGCTLEVEASASPISICQGENSILTATATGGSGVTYSWNQGLGAGSTHIVDPLFSTLYSVTASTPDGCSAVDSVLVEVSIPNLADAGPDQTVCGLTPVQLNASSNGSGFWSGGDGTYTDPSDPNTTYTPAASEMGFTVTLTWTTSVPGGACPDVSDSMELTVEEELTADAGSDQTVCGLASVQLNATANGPGFWTGGDGTYADETDPNTTYTPAAAEVGFTITLTWTTSDPGSTCPDLSDSMELTVEEELTADAGSDQTVCGLETIQLNASSNGSGFWSGGDGTYADPTDPTTTYTPAASEVGFSITLTWTTSDPGSTCPDVSDSMELTIEEELIADAGPDQTVCGLAPVQLNATANGPGFWTGGDGTYADETDPNTTYTPAAGEVGFSVTLTWTTSDPVSGVCPDVSDSMELTIEEELISDAGSDQIVCSYSVVQLNAISNGEGFWSGGLGVFSAPSNPISLYTPAQEEIGTEITLTWTTEGLNSSCHPSISNLTILILPEINIEIEIEGESCEGCNDATAIANVSGGLPPYTFLWSDGQTTEEAVGLSPGDYGLTVTDSLGCFQTLSFFINPFGCNTPKVDVTIEDVSCHGFNDGFISIDTILGNGPFTISWNTGDSTYIVSDLAPGIYEVKLIDSAGCKFELAFQITGPSVVLANLSITDESCFGCNNGTATISPSGVEDGYFVKWSTGDTTDFVENLSPGQYSFTITSGEGQCTLVEEFSIEVFVCPEIQIGVDVIDLFCHGDCDGAVIISEISNAIEPLEFEWSNGAESRDLFELCFGEYILTITDAVNCHLIDTFTIHQPDELIMSLNSDSSPIISGGTLPYQDTTVAIVGNWIIATVTDANGCTATDSLLISSQPELVSGQFVVYPNPFTNHLYLSLPVDEKVESIDLISVKGAAIYDLQNESNFLTIDDLPPGLYILRLVTNHRTESIKLIKLRE